MDTTNPAMQQSQYEANVNNKIYEGVIDIDPNTLDPIPRLAAAWDIDPWTDSALGVTDGAKYTYHLYPNATWHDGEAVTAHDLNFTMFEVIPQTLGEFNERQDIKKVEIPDDHTYVVYVNKSTYFEFIDITAGFGYVLPQHIWEPGASGNYSTFEPAVGTTWVGSGPFKIGSRVPCELIKLIRNEDWHFAIPHEAPVTPGPTPVSPFAVLLGLLTVVAIYSLRRRKD
jgi:peptide/nickel transport system substrate-binding protein